VDPLDDTLLRPLEMTDKALLMPENRLARNSELVSSVWRAMDVRATIRADILEARSFFVALLAEERRGGRPMDARSDMLLSVSLPALPVAQGVLAGLNERKGRSR